MECSAIDADHIAIRINELVFTHSRALVQLQLERFVATPRGWRSDFNHHICAKRVLVGEQFSSALV